MKLTVRLASPFRFFYAVGRTVIFLALGKPVIAPPFIRARRQSICSLCPRNEHGLCQVCGCFTDAKTLLSYESCPDTPPRWKKFG